MDLANVGGCLGDAEVTEDRGLALVIDSALEGWLRLNLEIAASELFVRLDLQFHGLGLLTT